MEARLTELGDVHAEYEAALAEKERVLAASGDPRAERLLEIAGEHGKLTAEHREVGEALAAGRRGGVPCRAACRACRCRR